MNLADGIGILAVLVLAVVAGCEKKSKPISKSTAPATEWTDTTMIAVETEFAQHKHMASNQPTTVSGQTVVEAQSPVTIAHLSEDTAELPEESGQSEMVTQAAEAPTQGLGQVRGDMQALARSAINLRKTLLNAQLTGEQVPDGKGERP